VFFTPAIVSGTAIMQHVQFVVWNFLASLGFSISVAASAYGVSRLFSGHYSARDIVVLVVGLLVGAATTMFYVRHRRRTRNQASAAPAS
jgi:membrane protein DedA with SNARE-associated domain